MYSYIALVIMHSLDLELLKELKKCALRKLRSDYLFIEGKNGWSLRFKNVEHHYYYVPMKC